MMHRAFVSLYALLVASVLVIGWSLNYFWERFAPEQSIPPETRALLMQVANDLHAGNPITTTLGDVHIDVLSLAELGFHDPSTSLDPAQVYMARTTDQWWWYQWVPSVNAERNVIVVRVPAGDERDSPLYMVLVIVFYAAMAAVVLAWVWPLSRDSRRLEYQTALQGDDGVPPPLAISSRSTLYPLAAAFNQMSDRLRELIASHRDMTNAVSHELRTPLARMKFALAMVEDADLAPNIRRQIDSIARDVDEMEQLITSLLRYAGFQQALSGIEQDEHPATLLADTIRTLVDRSYPSLALTMDNQIGDEPLRCEWSLMSTVLTNLVSNAAKYGATALTVSLTTDADAWLISVEDNGPGIAPVDRERAFDSFVRLYHATSEDGDLNTSSSGFGVGLAVVKRIMAWHHGSACCVSPQHLSGARFELRWPVLSHH